MSSNVKVECTDDKGRILVATKSLSAGQVIFQEEAYVFGSWHKFRCLVCDEAHDPDTCTRVEESFANLRISGDDCTRNSVGSGSAQKKSKYTYSEIEDALSEIEGIDELDRARTLLKCLRIYSTSEDEKDRLLSVFEELTTANLDKCMSCAAQIRENDMLAGIIPPGVADTLLGKLISGLNTNCHTLEDIGGSGLFLSACICEHSCVPNCNFSTNRTTLTLTAVRPIKEGESLTLDYGENYYRPTEERLIDLQDSYGFVCTCPACNGEVPDKSRAFECPKSSEHLAQKHTVFPPQWKCIGCGHQLAKEVQERYEQIEARHKEDPPESLEEVKNILEEKILKKEHYLLFDCLDAIAHQIASECVSAQDCIEQELELLWIAIIECIEATLPEFHFNKIIYYEQFAQIYVKLGDLDKAKEFFTKAYEMAERVVGKSELCPTTKDLESLAANPPKTVAELMRKYQNTSKEIEEQLKFEESLQS
eukprot:CAMPEP_0204867032 /NCGR_PEP_ID=MMETSP1348-20121228/20773_1 /ASSEMBLY_ACC=CAM_ASM_000700 /TAXON_ID=215587 /ORGANISM="Aplanochytrium stocchinoi, Strain GSBS06" /LENGTH=478 /DNA_ID=CAMNT_0052019257 /DNA_START=313 /DNA_END=1749 /DNA_ORIENTATION=-